MSGKAPAAPVASAVSAAPRHAMAPPAANAADGKPASPAAAASDLPESRRRSPGSALGSVTFSRSRNLIRLGFFLCLVCLGYVGFISYRNTDRLIETEGDVNRMQETRSKISDVAEASTDFEIGARSYILSGRPSDYADWQVASRQLQRQYLDMTALANDGTVQEVHLAADFLKLCRLRDDELRGLVERRREGQVPLPDEVQRLMRAETDSLAAQSRAARVFRSAEDELLQPLYRQVGVTWYQTQKTIIFGAAGAVLVVLGAILMIDRDMLVRKSVEAQLAASERRFRAIIENASDLITIIDPEGRVIYDSPSAARLAGLTPEGATGRFPIERVHPEDQPTLMAALEQAKRTTGVETPVSFRYRGPDGAYRWMESVASNQIKVKGVEGIVISTRDVTERREAEEAVRLSENRLREAQRIGGLGTWEYALETGEMLWSDEVYRLAGFNPADGPPPYETYVSRIHPDKRDAIARRIAEAQETGEDYEYDQTYLLPDGTMHHARATLHPVRDPVTGKVIRLTGTTYDITEIKEGERAREALLEGLRASERKLRQAAEELERSNRELSAFATVASHDLQEPLRKIRTFANIIERRTQGTLDEGTQDYVRRMKESSERMQSLVESVLELSRVSTRPRKPVPVDLGRVVADVLSDLEPRIEATGGRVEVAEPLPRLEADPIPFRQLVQNLIGNALKFHKPDEAPLVRVSANIFYPGYGGGATPDPWVQLTVTDNGIGFEPEYAERIFRAFERLEDRNIYEGNGVGLAICRRIVERHGGTITASAVPGEGATFTVVLPHGLPEAEGAATAGTAAV